MALSEIEEAKWLIANPDFNLRPANIREFCGRGYMNERTIRPGVMEALVETFGEEVDNHCISPVRRAVMTGAIGIGKSTYAAISLAYMVHWVKCLNNPRIFFGLSEDSIIGFMMMSTSANQAKEVIFQKVKGRINNSDWFQRYAPIQEENKKMQRQMRFQGQIWLVPGTSLDTSFEGYDILAGIIDEGDSHKVTEEKSYAIDGFNTIESRIESRFMDFKAKKHRGLIIVIGQAKSRSGFILTKFNEFEKDPDATAYRMTIWESFGWHNFTKDPNDVDRGVETAERDSFYYDQRHRRILSKEAAKLVMNKSLIEVPMAYIRSFENDPVKALSTLAGIPPEVEDPFISQTDRILDCQDKWHDRFNITEPPLPGNVTDISKLILPSWFNLGLLNGEFKRVLHIDTATAGGGDAVGIAMGHIPEKIIRYNQERPLVVFDLLVRIKVKPGFQVDLDEVRHLIYRLRDEFGFDIDLVTMDGYQSVDMVQMLRKNHVKADHLSVDKLKAPYEDLRETINGRRCLHPRYMVQYRIADTTEVNIAYKELSELQDVGTKIDHPKDGSKDVADAMAGVVHVLINSSKYTNEARTVEDVEFIVKEREVDFDKINELLNRGLEEDSGIVHPVSFEEFAKNQAKYLKEANIPTVDFNLLTRGNGALGYPAPKDITW